MSDHGTDEFAIRVRPDHDPDSTKDADAGRTASVWETVVGSAITPPSVHLDGDLTDEGQGPPGDGPATRAASGRYSILGEIARGGMGAVLRGRDAELNRDLAFKVLLDAHRDKPDVLRRFFEEAQIGGQLQHPGIVPIYDLGVLPDRRPFFAMKLVKGRTMTALLQGRSTPADDLARFLSIFGQVAQTVAYAHSRSVIHRDLKPLNVMVGAFGEVQVMDWGLAKVLSPGEASEPATEADPHATMSVIDSGRGDSDADETSAGSRLGTPAYMPPEQARGEVDRISKPSDVFSLGAILCEILTGSPAYTGRTQAEILRKAEFADLTDALSRLDACGADPDLIALAHRCLSREPGDRPADASEVADAISAHSAAVQDRLRAAELARVEADARAEVEKTKSEASRARLRMTVAAAASLLLAVAVGSGSFLSFRLASQIRQAESDRIVGDALARAEALSDEAQRSGTDALDAWRAASIAAENARTALAGRSPRADLRSRVEIIFASSSQSLAKAQMRADRLASARLLVRRLEEARLKGANWGDGHFEVKLKINDYASAFREVGVDFGKQPVSKSLSHMYAQAASR